MEEKRNLAIIFTDLKGFSSLPDALAPAIERINSKIESEIVAQHHPVFVNTWGDAFFICLNSCTSAAEVALRIRDYLRTYDWVKDHFPSALLPRIGIHFAEVTITYGKDGAVSNVVGKSVSAAARIEPMVEPGKVFCSHLFQTFLTAGEDTRFKTSDLGSRELAKGFGVMQLHELFWSHEVAAGASSERQALPARRSPHVPMVPKRITDRDRKDFVEAAYLAIRDYFQAGAREISQSSTSLHVKILDVNEFSFYAELYDEGDLKNAMKVWLGGAFGANTISCSDGRHVDIHATNSCNESLHLEDGEGEMFLNASFGSVFGSENYDFDIKRMSGEQAGEHLWIKFIGNV